MSQLVGFLVRVLYAVLAGVVTFLIVWVIGAVTTHYDASIGNKIEDFAPPIGLLVGAIWLLAGPWIKAKLDN